MKNITKMILKNIIYYFKPVNELCRVEKIN